jgi:hypothetical protein
MERPGPGLPRSGEGLAAKRQVPAPPPPAAGGGKKPRPLSHQSWLRWDKPSGGLILTGWDLAKGAEARYARSRVSWPSAARHGRGESVMSSP